MQSEKELTTLLVQSVNSQNFHFITFSVANQFTLFMLKEAGEPEPVLWQDTKHMLLLLADTKGTHVNLRGDF